MATEQIPTGIIADDAVTTAKVADDAITGALIENNPTIAGNLTVSGTSTLTGALTASGGIANAGTISAGTLGSSVVVPPSIGGGEVLLNTYTADNSSNIIAITGMSTTYTTYKFVVTALKPATASIHVYWFLKETGGTVRSSGYRGGHNRQFHNGSSSGNGETPFGDTLFGINSDLDNGPRTYNGVFYVFNPADSALVTQGTGIWNYVSEHGYNISVIGGSHYATAEAHPAINLQTESGNWYSGTVRMYGIK